MEEKIEILIDPQKMNNQGILYTILIGIVSLSLFYMIWGFHWELSGIAFLKFYLYFLIGIFIHEIIHAISFIIFGKAKIKEVKLGIIWSKLTPYAHCKVPMKIVSYKISILLPVIITGIIPMIIAMSTESLLMVLVSAFLIAGGIGDWIVYKRISTYSNAYYIRDHPTEIGCIIENRRSIDSFMR